MKILCYGNCGNLNFMNTRWLRDFGFEADLFIPTKVDNPKSHPEWQNPNMIGNYPDWIKTISRSPINAIVPEKEIRKIQYKYDIVVTTGLHIISALTLKLPIVFVPVGSDLSKAPFGKNEIDKLHQTIYLRRIKNLHHVITHVEEAHEAATKLNIENIYNIPLPIDINQIINNIDKDYHYECVEKLKSFEKVFFLPCRKNILKTHHTYKGIEKFLYAFKKLVSSSNNTNFRCISVSHGDNINEFNNIIKKLELQKYFISTPILSLPKLHAIMSMPNAVVIDRFPTTNRGCLGGISREALAIGAPLITCSDPSLPWFKKAYPDDCPLFSAFSEEDILYQINQIISLSDEKLNNLKKYSKNWALMNLHFKNTFQQYIDVYRHVVQTSSNR